MITWIDDILVENLSQPISNHITQITRANCYKQATVAASIAFVCLASALFSIVPIIFAYAGVDPQVGFAGTLLVLVLTTADLLMIWRSRYLSRTTRFMTISPDRIKFLYWRTPFLLFVTVQLLVMNSFASIGFPPNAGSWFMLAHHLAATASMYLMACTPFEPPPITAKAPTTHTA